MAGPAFPRIDPMAAESVSALMRGCTFEIGRAHV